MAFRKPLSASTALLALMAVALCGCGSTGNMVVFRDLADIPDRPEVTASELNDQAVQSLMEDRARTAQAAESLRREPFAPPDPAPARPEP